MTEKELPVVMDVRATELLGRNSSMSHAVQDTCIDAAWSRPAAVTVKTPQR